MDFIRRSQNQTKDISIKMMSRITSVTMTSDNIGKSVIMSIKLVNIVTQALQPIPNAVFHK